MEKKRKIVVYQKNVSKPVLMHDGTDKPLEQLQKELQDCFVSQNVHTFRTDTDILIIRPSEIAAILISKEGNEKENLYKSELNKDSSSEKGKK